MSSPSSLPLQVLTQLQGAHEQLTRAQVLVGFDGFVDTILHVVRTRESATSYARMDRTLEFSERIAAAAGQSGNFELVTQMVKLGGNGPIMAHALGRYGLPITYIGNLGAPSIHPIFADFNEEATVYSIAEPGYTDAIEFDDAKLMLGKHESLKEVNWATLLRYLPEPELLRIISESHLIALVNWTMLAQMGEILEQLLVRIAPQLTGERRWLFFDLADPAKRSREDLSEVLRQISRFEPYFRVILGLNLAESWQVGEVLGLPLPDESAGAVARHALDIREVLQIDTVVIHPTSFAAAADHTSCTHVVGPYTPKPRLTTGAGDHFNAGFCLGRLLGLDLAGSLQLGVATSGYYVRQAASPSLEDMQAFLPTLAAD